MSLDAKCNTWEGATMDYDGLVDGLFMVKFDTAEDVHCKTTLHAAADGVIAHFIVPW